MQLTSILDEDKELKQGTNRSNNIKQNKEKSTQDYYYNPNQGYNDFEEEDDSNDPSNPQLDMNTHEIIEDEMNNERKGKSTIVRLTSDELLFEYSKMVKYLIKSYYRIIIFCILCIIYGLLSNKYLKNSQINLTIIIMSSLILCFTVMVLFFVYTNFLLDQFLYIVFYLFSFAQSIMLIVLFFMKVINTALEFKDLQWLGGSCPEENSYCKSYFLYLFMNVMCIATAVLIVLLIAYPCYIAIRGLRVCCGKVKTIAQRQLDINNSNKFQEIEFADENKKGL